jgi:hypothetical protein
VLGAEAAEAELDLRWVRAARAALVTGFAAKPAARRNHKATVVLLATSLEAHRSQAPDEGRPQPQWATNGSSEMLLCLFACTVTAAFQIELTNR